MSCEEALERMMMALDGDLSAEDEEALAAHLEVCGPCRARWERLQAAEALLRSAPLVSPPPGFVGRVMARVDRRRARQRAFFGGLALAMGTALILLISCLPLLRMLPGWANFTVAFASYGGDVLLSHLVSAARLLARSLGVLAGAVFIRMLPLALCSLMTALLLAGLWWNLLRRWRPVVS